MANMKSANFSHSGNFPSLLVELNSSLLVTTYQAGQVCSFGTHEGQLHVALEPFSVAMGLALHPRKVAVGSRGLIWFLESGGRDLAQSLAPAGRYDAALLSRSAHVTGSIQTHEMAFLGDELWIVNTLFSCLATIQPGYNFVPRWKPKFISNCHVPGDRCHLNGLAIADGQPKYVTAMAESDTPGGWRTAKDQTGLLMEVTSQQVVCRGLAMPHSPRVYRGQVWVLDSGRGQLVRVDPQSGRWEVVTTFPGYARGLAFSGSLAFVGLSRIRETSVFGGLPIASRREQLKCGVGVVDLRSGQQVAAFQFVDGVEEIFDVQVLPGIRCPALRGPLPKDEHTDEIWVAPSPAPGLESTYPILNPQSKIENPKS